MRIRKVRGTRSLPDFFQRLQLRRETIARSLSLNPPDDSESREIDAALEDLAYWLEPIGNVPPVELELAYHREQSESALAA